MKLFVWLSGTWVRICHIAVIISNCHSNLRWQRSHMFEFVYMCVCALSILPPKNHQGLELITHESSGGPPLPPDAFGSRVSN